jgi:hypothetical protein
LRFLAQHQTSTGNVDGRKQRNIQTLQFQPARESFFKRLDDSVSRAGGDAASTNCRAGKANHKKHPNCDSPACAGGNSTVATGPIGCQRFARFIITGARVVPMIRWQYNFSLRGMIERYLLIMLAVVLLGSIGAFFLFAAILPVIATAAILTGLAAMFGLGFRYRAASVSDR